MQKNKKHKTITWQPLIFHEAHDSAQRRAGRSKLFPPLSEPMSAQPITERLTSHAFCLCYTPFHTLISSVFTARPLSFLHAHPSFPSNSELSEDSLTVHNGLMADFEVSLALRDQHWCIQQLQITQTHCDSGERTTSVKGKRYTYRQDTNTLSVAHGLRELWMKKIREGTSGRPRPIGPLGGWMEYQWKCRVVRSFKGMILTGSTEQAWQWYTQKQAQ